MAVASAADIFVESLLTVSVVFLELALYLSSPEYVISALWFPALNSGSLTVAVPFVTCTVSTTSPSTLRVTFPSASLGSLISIDESPKVMSDGIVMSGVMSCLETLIVALLIVTLSRPT